MATIESRGGRGQIRTNGGTFKVSGDSAFILGDGGAGGGAGAVGGDGYGAPNGGSAGLDGVLNVANPAAFTILEIGGPGGNGTATNGAGGGGGGGNGFVFGGSGAQSITLAASGGAGGRGGDSTVNGYFGGGGGSGGYGGAFTATVQVTASASLTGGSGGGGGRPSSGGSFAGTDGGDGGGGIYFASSAVGSSLTVDGGVTFTGGAGGAGGVGGNFFSGRPGFGGSGGAGAVMTAQGSITNSGTVQGGNGGAPGVQGGGTGGAGVAFNGGSASNFNSLINSGLIQGGNANNTALPSSAAAAFGGAGIVGASLVVDNSAAGARIAGGFNNLSGTGTQADAITYTGGSNNLLVLGAGTLAGGIGVSGTLNVGNGGTASSVNLANVVHDGPNGAGSLGLFSIFGGGTNLTLSGNNTYSGGTSLTEGSTLTLNGSAAYNGSGTLVSGAAGTGAITFTNGTATGRLVLPLTAQPTAANTTFSNTITGFSTGSQIDIAGLTGAMASYNSTNSQLTVTGTSGGASVTQNYRLTLADPAQAGNFQTQSDGNGGTLVTLCFAGGTLIRTSRGDVAVEDLRVGDVAVTASGALRPITWIGHRALEAAGKPLPHDQQPVRIRAGAFGHDASGRSVPARPLLLSPGHPVLVGADADMSGGVLVPVMCLINGISITRQTSATTVTYWHVELEAHDILLAEGLPAESYYDMGSRAWFAGRDGALIDIDFVPAGAHGRCRPVAIEGAVVEAERGRLDGVFAAYLAAQCAWREPAVA